jgi:hypothetical protein
MMKAQLQWEFDHAESHAKLARSTVDNGNHRVVAAR